MAGNRLPTTINQLFALAKNMADGAGTYGGAIELLQNTEARIRRDYDATRIAYRAYSLAKDAKTSDLRA